MLLWGATYYVRYVKHDANDSLCIICFAVTARCGIAALAVIAHIRIDTIQHMIHIKIYILAQLYHKLQHRLIYVHIPHKKSQIVALFHNLLSPNEDYSKRIRT